MDKLINLFQSVTGSTDADAARRFLQKADMDINKAVDDYYGK